MRKLIAASALALIAACGGAAAPSDSFAATRQVTAPQADTQLIAVLSYASWCGNCKVLDPKISSVLAANTFEGVEFLDRKSVV